MTLFVNGREFDSATYTADPDDYEEKKIEIEGLYSRNGEITAMNFDEHGRYHLITAQVTDWNGQNTVMYFLAGSPESIYLFDGEED